MLIGGKTRLILRGVAFGMVGLVALTVVIVTLFLRFGAGPTADRILANIYANRDREFPITAVPTAQSAGDVIVVGGKGQGLSCSLPWLLEKLVFSKESHEASINLQMRQACTFHDYCYRHGAATYAYTQADCDFLLQEQAFRLCKFIAETDRQTLCQTRARLILLGVRLGGSDSFKTAGSTYFEFDPFPYRAQNYRIFRIADAPLDWVAQGAVQKAVFIFDIRASVTKVTVVGRSAEIKNQKEFCEGYELVGRYDSIAAAPRVVKSGAGEDLFVWWQRARMTETRGRFVMLSTKRAMPADWDQVYGKSFPFVPTGCSKASLRRVNPALMFRERERAVDVISGDSESDYEFSELHFEPWRPNLGLLARAYALKTHPCVRGTNLLCFMKFSLASEDASFRVIPDDKFGFASRTGIFESYGITLGPKEREPDRYRSFVLPPFPMRFADQTLISFVRRGASDGSGYGETTDIRRFGVVEKKKKIYTGQSFGRVVLLGHHESHDPVIPLGNADASISTVLSLMARDGNIALEIWPLPIPVEEKRGMESVVGQVAAKKVSFCKGEALDEAWLNYPPVILASSSVEPKIMLRFPASQVRDQGNYQQVRFATFPLDLKKASVDDTYCLKVSTATRSLFGENKSWINRFARNRSNERRDRQSLDPQANPDFAVPIYYLDMNSDGKADLVTIDFDQPSASQIDFGFSDSLTAFN